MNQKLRMRALWAVGFLVAPLLVFSGSAWVDSTLFGAGLRALGQVMVMAAVLGRLWSALNIGGRKNDTLVVEGPYSICRNPLYLFSTIGAVGIGLLFGSLLLAALLGLAAGLILYAMARREASFLADRFGEAYRHYAWRTPLMWPRLSLYQSGSVVEPRLRNLWREARDGMVFLAAIPATELLQQLRRLDALPTLVTLY